MDKKMWITVGTVIFRVPAHLYGLHLEEGIAPCQSQLLPLAEQRSADASPLVFLPHPHDRKLRRILSRFLYV